jgi:hypothetical protein
MLDAIACVYLELARGQWRVYWLARLMQIRLWDLRISVLVMSSFGCFGGGGHAPS